MNTQNATPAEQDQVFLARQPIVDRGQNIVGYELLFRRNATTESARVTDAPRADVNILENALANMGTEWLPGSRLAFINASLSLLKSDFLSLLPAGRFVLELQENFPACPENLELCRQLRGKGFRFALDSFAPTPERQSLLEVADYVKLDARLLNSGIPDGIQAPQVIATRVESRDSFAACKGAGAALFQGYYFAKPENLSAKTLNPSLIHMLDLLKKVRMNAEMREIEQMFKLDVALTYRLLRYINSAALRRRTEIRSIRGAITQLGYHQLYRWLTLLLITAGEENVAPVLVKTAITRGRLTELLGQIKLDAYESDSLFIVGVFSLLDILLDMPMEKILQQLSLPESIGEALLRRQGIYGPCLSLAEACEAEEAGRIAALAGSLAIDPMRVNRLHLEALAWAETLGP